MAGGGFTTLWFDLLAGTAATQITAPPTRWRTWLGSRLTRLLARLWPWLLIAYLAWAAGSWIIAAISNAVMLALTPAVSAATPTKFRSAVASMGRTAEMLIQCTRYDRPRRLASLTTMQQADISYTLTFEPAGTGSRMLWSGQVHPKRAFRLLGPVITWMGRRQERRIWTSLKRRLEITAARPVTRPGP